MVYHVLNRGSSRMRLFQRPGLRCVRARADRGAGSLPGRAVDLLPHAPSLASRRPAWHASGIGRIVGLVAVTHVRRRHERDRRRGACHLFQGRYENFPVDQDEYFLTLRRYVEANAEVDP
jgi:hypothetical protein